MIAIGIDIVTISRFHSWCHASDQQLAVLFSPYEREQLLLRQDQPLASQAAYLASRFAAKEAFYKALSSWLAQHNQTEHSFSFKRCAPHVWVACTGVWKLPHLFYDKEAIQNMVGGAFVPFLAQVTLSHEEQQAVAQVVLST